MCLIGIPVYKDIKRFEEMIISLINSADLSSHTIIIVQSETPEVHKICEKLPQNLKIEIIDTLKEGPIKAYEKLFNIAKERKQDLFLTQTDVLFPTCKKDWMNEVLWCAQRKDCGMITCWAGGGSTNEPHFIEGFRWVGAWFTYIPYRTIEKIGGYDMNIPIGYGVDVDYSMAILKAGLNVYLINYWVNHMPEYEITHEHERRDDMEEIKQEAYRYMREKWKIGEYSNELDR